MALCRLMIFRLALLLLSLGLAGCISMERQIVPGQSLGADVLKIYGKPSRIWADSDGGRTLEYSSQPLGQTCYMVKLGADDKVRSVEDTLTEANRLRIEPGMTPDQVSRMLGRERTRVSFSLSQEDVWDWNVAPNQSGYLLRFNVHFKEGRVFRTSQSVEYPTERPWLLR